jgi:LmbE family N-acetylglucosaminyl deacetylase
MKLHKATSEIWIPDGKPQAEGLGRTTHLGVSAHQDDLEIMAGEGILAGFGHPDVWFSGVIVTDGAGSARDGLYAHYTDEHMKAVRRVEQKKAAFVGEYGAMVFLDFTSAEVKDPANREPIEDLKAVIEAAAPEVVYIHNLADKHPTHIATAMRTLAAIRELPAEKRPRKLLGCEVWRDLDWMVDADKRVMNLDGHENILSSLVGVFDSQVVGGKRYDLATMGRRRAHATYHDSHKVDAAKLINFAMDLTPLVQDDSISPLDYVLEHIKRFEEDVRSAVSKFL